MGIVSVHQNGAWDKTTRWFRKVTNFNYDAVLAKYGEVGVQALSLSTPVDTGRTSHSWKYEIKKDVDSSGNGTVRITFSNTNLAHNWFSVALGLYHGHATGTGGWVEGRDYIDPAIQPVFDTMAANVWKEVTDW